MGTDRCRWVGAAETPKKGKMVRVVVIVNMVMIFLIIEHNLILMETVNGWDILSGCDDDDDEQLFNNLNQGVVHNAGDNIETVNNRESDQQLVERGSHLRTPEHQHDHVFGDNKSDDVLVTKIRRLLAAMTNK